MSPYSVVPEFVAIVLSIAASGLLATTVGFGVAWFRARDRALRAEAVLKTIPAGTDPARFDRLEVAIDAIAIELERISEAERFQSKLMAGREMTGGR